MVIFHLLVSLDIYFTCYYVMIIILPILLVLLSDYDKEIIFGRKLVKLWDYFWEVRSISIV